LDGEIVIFQSGHLSFDDLLMRIHPAESRIRKLAAATPVTLWFLITSGGGQLADSGFCGVDAHQQVIER